ncbi:MULTISPECIES: pyocin activator PrtN family protein [Vibrio]|uniref:pyocin activator PrtN family protein n=1 Tax=Vibrio TaxID=662 RepID=UPI000635C21B|nr:MULTISPECIES: pyocin activator PrtN family protein [Vibrio]PMI73926.1 hypothetical protein BCU38_16510 [Vibrio splendidus]CDT41737.1 conserved hypothetical protein [Vibrio coralliirubri]CDT93297.1 conserved hypothetical protein [Vibrio coralliirubri]
MIPNLKNLDARMMLLITFGMSPVVSVRDIAVEYLGMSPNTALKKARDQALPLPTFRLGDSQKADWVVSIDDLAQLITQSADKARVEWQELQSLVF